MFVNIIKSYRDVIAICDKDLVGKKFEEGILQLDLKENFYKGKEVSEKKLLEIMEDCSKEGATFNIAGEQAVKTALKAGIIEESEIKKVEGVPFALVLL